MELLLEQIKSIINKDIPLVSNLSNISSILYKMGDVNWAGFYLVENDTLYVGPFQGDVACAIINKGKGGIAHRGQHIRFERCIERQLLSIRPQLDEQILNYLGCIVGIGYKTDTKTNQRRIIATENLVERLTVASLHFLDVYVELVFVHC